MNHPDQTVDAKKTDSTQQAEPPKIPAPTYEPPKLSKFDKLEKLIISGE